LVGFELGGNCMQLNVRKPYRGWRDFVGKVSIIVAAALALAPADTVAKGAAPRFEPSACPTTPEPIDALKTARCGMLVVPENRAHDAGRSIRLAVAILPAQSPNKKADPIVFMSGGPGAAAIVEIPFLVHAGINRDRDLIVMTQRGTLFDLPNLDCPELDQFYARQVSLQYDAPSTGRLQAAAAAACRKRLTAEGIDLSAYNTTENEADFVDLRRALGIPIWNVYGYSYGTDLALSFMRDHSDGIRTVTIDSVVPPDIVRLPWTWSSAHEGITTIFAACEKQPSCARHYPHLLDTLNTVVRRLEAKPIVATVRPASGGDPVKVVLDGGTVINMLVGNVIKPPKVPSALTELAHGNAMQFLQTRAGAGIIAETPEQAMGMTMSFVCREWDPYGSPSAIRAAGKRKFPDFPDSVLVNAPQLPFQRELCRAWNVPKGPDAQRVPAHSNIPTLVVSGNFDAKTGAEWGRHPAATLPNSTYVQINGMTHWAIAQSPCAQQILQSFLDHPKSPDIACAARTGPEPFTIR
jgi:pimeloyl-ACP methyl ester carboxylesterase